MSSPLLNFDPELFTISLQGQMFQLDAQQINFDPSPMFRFEYRDDPLYSTRSPLIFSIIVDYLNGYEVIPIVEGRGGMSRDQVETNLLLDAEHFGLKNLVQLLKTCQSE